MLAAAIPVIGLLVLLVMVARARPSLGETALAVDAEGGVGRRDRLRARVRRHLARRRDRSTKPPTRRSTSAAGFDVRQAEERFVRRQRRDALGRLHAVEPAPVPAPLRAAARPVALVAIALIVPARAPAQPAWTP